MEQTVAFTIAFGQQAKAAARLLRLTFKLQHPEIPFLIIDDSFYPAFAGQREIAHAGEIVGLRIMIGYFLSLCYRRVIYFDSDVLILAPLPRLVEAAEPAVLTQDTAKIHYGLPTTPINVGVLAATTPEFWRRWMLTDYSFVVPPIGIFFDQFSIRVLCMRNLIAHSVIPEAEEKDYYNITCRDHPGPWRREGAMVFKGDARVRLWHWAGYAEKCTLDYLPDPLKFAIKDLLKGPLPGAEAKRIDLREEQRVHQALREQGQIFWAHIAGEFAGLSTHVLLNTQEQNPDAPQLIFGADIPAAWDALRPAMPGIHRRYLSKAPRYLYSIDRDRLFSEEAESYNRPWKTVE